MLLKVVVLQCMAGVLIGLQESWKTSEVLSWLEECHPQMHIHLEPQSMTLFRHRTFADVIKLR